MEIRRCISERSLLLTVLTVVLLLICCTAQSNNDSSTALPSSGSQTSTISSLSSSSRAASSSSTVGGFINPVGVAVARFSSGDVFVLDCPTTLNCTVHKFTADWSPLAQFPLSYNSSDGSSFQYWPTLSVDRLGNYYVIVLISVAANTSVVIKSSGTDGSILLTISLPFIVLDTAVDEQNNLYISDATNGRAIKVDAVSGKNLTEYSIGASYPLTFPWSIAVDNSTGHVLLLDLIRNGVYIFDYRGELQSYVPLSWTTWSDAQWLAVNAKGDIYTIDRGQFAIAQFSLYNFSVQNTYATSNPKFGYSIGNMALDQDSNIYVADRNNARVVIFYADYVPPPSSSSSSLSSSNAMSSSSSPRHESSTAVDPNSNGGLIADHVVTIIIICSLVGVCLVVLCLVLLRFWMDTMTERRTAGMTDATNKLLIPPA